VPGVSREVIDLYDARAFEYDAWFRSPLGSRVLAAELAALNMVIPDAIGRSLDIGCGTGVFSTSLKVDIGLDPSISELLIARRRRLDVVQAVAEALPFQSESHDTAFMILSLCFISKPVLALQEAARVLKPGGALVCAELNRDSALGAEYSRRKTAGDPFYSLASLYSLPDMLQMIRAAGFRAEAYASTLRQLPSAEGAPEAVEPAMIPDAGFVAIRSAKD
jgi:ubiquinone/menaquinone biosynthesis C-methylase UbiE